MKIQILHNGQVVFNETGELNKIKMFEVGKLYKFYVGDKCLDDILWNLVDRIIEFKISNIDKLEESEDVRNGQTAK